MFCTKCGANNPDGTSFCTQCGNPMGNQPVNFNRPNNQNFNTYNNVAHKPSFLSKSSSSLNLLAGFAFLASFIIYFLSLMFLNSAWSSNFIENITYSFATSFGTFLMFEPLILILFLGKKDESLAVSVSLPALTFLGIFCFSIMSKYSIMNSFVQFLQFAAWGSLLFIVTVCVFKNFSNLKDSFKNLYFLPAAIMLTSVLFILLFDKGFVNIFDSLNYMFTRNFLSGFSEFFGLLFDLLSKLLLVAAAFLIGKWVTD